MANETGTTVAPSNATGKSVGVSGATAVQMLVKRQAAVAAKPAPSAEPTPAQKAETSTEATPKPAPSEVTTEVTPSVEVTKTEAKATTPEPEQTPPDEVLSTLSQEQKERIERRIGKEVAKRKTLEDEITRLRILANATPQIPMAPVAALSELRPDSPIAAIMDPAELNRRVEEAQQVQDWAQSQLDAEVSEAKLGGMTYDKQALRNAVRNSEKFISREVPKQMAYIQQKGQFDRQTAETFGSEPWMQDRSSEGYQAYLQILRDPDIAKRPQASWIAAVQVQGLQDVQRRKKAAGQPAEPAPAPKQKAPAAQTAQGGGFAPSREAGSTKAVQALAQEMERLKGKKGITGRELESYFQKTEQARSTR